MKNNQKDKTWWIKKIKSIDKNNYLSLSDSHVTYPTEIEQKTHTRELTPEELVRAYWVAYFMNVESINPKRMQIEKHYSIGHKSKKQALADLIIYKSNSTNIEMIIEFKKSESSELRNLEKIFEEQLYSLAALEVGNKNSVDFIAVLSEPEIHEYVVDFNMFLTFDLFKNHGTNQTKKVKSRLDVLFVKQIGYDLDITASQNRVENLANLLHNRLWMGSGDQNQIFGTLVKLLLAKIFDEKNTAVGEPYKFQIYPNESDETLISRINDLYKDARKFYFKDAPADSESSINWQSFGKDKILATIKLLKNFNFSEIVKSNNKDVFGEFFETILSSGFKQTKGQYFTDANIVDFITKNMHFHSLIQNVFNKKGQNVPKIADTSVGSATFLISAMKQITKAIDEYKDSGIDEVHKERFKRIFSLTEENNNSWASDILFGFDVDANLVETSKLNMILHGDGASNIYQVSSSLDKFVFDDNRINEDKTKDGMFDAIISNPPYLKVTKEQKESLSKSKMFSNEYADLEEYFIDRFVTLLKNGGRLGVVLPASIFENQKKQKIRMKIFENFQIISLIELPETAFEPFTKTRTYIMFARREKSGHKGDIMGYRVEEIGYKKYAFRNSKNFSESDLDKISIDLEEWND